MAQQETMTLKRFQKKFNSDKDCHKHLFQIRWENGFCCPKCGHKEYYYLQARKLHQCKSCKHQTSVTAGTVMHKLHVSLHIWFWAFLLVSHDKRGVSAAYLSREL